MTKPEKDKAADVISLKVSNFHGSRRCPLCGKPAAEKFQPFCSGRCADLDLGKWLKEDYRFATDERPGPEDGEKEDGEDEGEDYADEEA